MASGAPKKVLTVAMTLGLMASVLNAVPTAVVAQENDRVVGGNAGAAVATGEETADLALLHKRANYNPLLQQQQQKLPPQQKLPQTQVVHIDDRENVVGDKVDFNIAQHFRNVPGDLICVYGLPPGLRFARNGHVVGQPTTQGNFKVRVLVKDTYRGYVTAESNFNWKIQPRNAAPKLEVKDVSFPATGQEGTTAFVPLNVSDDQPIDQLTFKVEGIAGAKVVFAEGSWKLQVPTTNPSSNTVKVTVVDKFGASDDETFKVDVVEQKVNQAPVVSFVPVAQQATGYAGTKATAVVYAKDDGLPSGQLTARPKTPLPAGWVFGGSNGQWTITVPSDKPIPLTGIEVVVSDGELETVVTVGICVWEKPAVPQYAPIGLVQPVSTIEGKPVDAGIFVYDADTHISKLKVEVVGENPAGVVPKRNADGTWILHVPATKVTNGAVLTELKVTDDTGLSTTFPAVVTVSKNIPAVIGDIANQSHWVGTKIDLPVPVDPSYFGQVEVAGLPAGLQYDPATGKIVGTTIAPTQGAQKATVSLIVGGQRVTKEFTWTVIAIGDRSNNIGDKVDWDITKNLPSGVKPGDVQANGLPEGLELKNGRVTGTVAGGVKVYKVTFTVVGQSHKTVFNWDVKAKGNKAPTVDVRPLVGQQGKPFTPVVLNITDDTTPLKDLKVEVKTTAPVKVEFDGKQWVLKLDTAKKLDATAVEIVVTDKEGLKGSTSTWAVVSASQSKGKLVDTPDQTGWVNKPIKPIVIQVLDAQPGDRVTVDNLPNGLTFDPKTNTISGTPTEVKKTEVVVSLYDENGVLLDRDDFDIDIKAPLTPPANKAPVVYAPDVIFPEGQTREVGITVTDEDPKTVKVEITTPVPGVSVRQGADGGWVLVADGTKPINAKVTLVPTDKEGLKGNPHTLTVQTFRAQISDLDPLGKQTVNVGSEIKPVQVKINNEQPGDSLEIVGVPAWLKFDPQTKTFSGAPTAPGTYTVTVILRSAAGVLQDTEVLTIEAKEVAKVDIEVEDGETIVNTPLKPIKVEVKNADPKDVEFNKPLPKGLTYDPAKGTIAGTPTEVGVYEIIAHVSNTAGGKDSDEFKITVKPATPAPGKVDIEVEDGETIVNTPLNPIKVDVKNADPKDVKFNKPLPKGLTYDPAKGTIAGTPTEVGVTEITATVTTADGRTDSDTFKITVKPEQPKPNVKAPTGLVNPVIAFKGDPTVRREIFVEDPDTDDDKLVVSLVKAPAGVSLVKEDDRWFMVVTTDNVIPTSQVDFKVSDGQHENAFSTSVTVKDRDPQDKTPSIDNPGGQTSEVGEKIDPLKINTHNVPKGETPKVEGLPEGLKPSFDPTTGVITIEGTPTKPTPTPVNVTITVTNPNKPTEPVKVEFPWQVNEKGGEDLGPKGWVDPVKEKVAEGKKVEKPVKLADADTPIKDLTVTMTNKIDGVELVKKAPGEYVLVVDLSKPIDLTKGLFQVTDGKYITLFENTILVEKDQTGPGQTEYGPTGEVNPVIAWVGDPKVRREIFLKDQDTKIEDLKLELVKGPEQAKLVKEGNRYFLEVTTEKKLDTTFVSFKVTDGKHTNEFGTTVTVKDRAPEDKTPSIDNPGGQTSTEGKPIDPLVIPGHNIPKGETPKVEGLPEGLTPKYDPDTQTITITGTPTKPTDKPNTVVITVTDPKKPTEPVKVEFPWQVNPDKTKDKKYPPVGQVDSVHEKVGANGGKVTKPISLHDNDTDPRDLVVTLTNPIEGVKLVQTPEKKWELEVSTEKVIPLTVLRFRVTDGDHTDLFENTVSVYDKGTDPVGEVDIDVPDGKTIVNTPLPTLKVTVQNADLAAVKITPELPDGIKYDPAKGEISGTPTKVGVTKHTATVTNAQGKTDTDDFTITVTDAVKPTPSDPGFGPGNTPVPIPISGTRIQGPTRVETAIAVSRRQFKDQSVQHVVIARDDQYADANAGTPFADTKSAPVLLTQSGTLHPDVEKEIRRILKPGGEIWIMGREVAIHKSVEEDLVKKFTGHAVHRIGGENRFETAAMIYDRLGKPEIVSIVDGGNDYVGDALVAGAAMAYKDGAVLYTSLGKLAPETAPVFEKNKITTKYTYDSKVTNGFTIIGGKDIVERSISTAKLHWGTSVNQIGVAAATERNVVDALTGGAMVARRKAPMLLTPVDVNDKRLSEYVSTFSKSSLKKIWLYGGTAAVPQNVADALGGAGVKIEWDTFNWTDKTPEDPDKI